MFSPVLYVHRDCYSSFYSEEVLTAALLSVKYFGRCLIFDLQLSFVSSCAVVYLVTALACFLNTDSTFRYFRNGICVQRDALKQVTVATTENNQNNAQNVKIMFICCYWMS